MFEGALRASAHPPLSAVAQGDFVMPENADTDPKPHRALDAQAKGAFDLEKQEDLRLSRFLLGGNAGGSIASLSFIGALVGSGAPHFPRMLFFVFVIFLVGLAFSWLELTSRLDHARSARRFVSRESWDPNFPPKDGSKDPRAKLHFQTIGRLAWSRLVSGGCLIAGTVLALNQLYGLTSP